MTGFSRSSGLRASERSRCDHEPGALASVVSMLRLFQITGSASFAARAALEEAGAEYEAVNVHPRRRDEQA